MRAREPWWDQSFAAGDEVTRDRLDDLLSTATPPDRSRRVTEPLRRSRPPDDALPTAR